MIDYKTDYSEKELKLFEALGLSYLTDRLYAVELYKIAARNAFIENLSGPLAVSLRRCCAAIDKCSPYRRTPEFDALINVEPIFDKIILEFLSYDETNKSMDVKFQSSSQEVVYKVQVKDKICISLRGESV